MGEGLRREPLFGRKERLYADPEEAPAEKPAKKPVEKPVRPVTKKQEPVTQPAETFNEEQEANSMRGWISTGLELLGIASLTAGGFLIAPWLGLMILGVLLVVLGVATGYGA